MLSKTQRSKLAEVGTILVKIAESNDSVERSILAANANLRLQEVVHEDVNEILRDMIDVPDFLKP